MELLHQKIKNLSLLWWWMYPPGKEEDIHLGHALARGSNAAAHKGAKNAPQMPALPHGPRRTPLPSPAPHPPPQQSRDLEVIMKVERY